MSKHVNMSAMIDEMIKKGTTPQQIKNLSEYRSMTEAKKLLAEAGDEGYQREWAEEEVTEFVQALIVNTLHNEQTGVVPEQDIQEAFEEAFGLIRIVQQWPHTAKTVAPVGMSMLAMLAMRIGENRVRFEQWLKKKQAKGQAQDITVIEDLLPGMHLISAASKELLLESLADSDPE